MDDDCDGVIDEDVEEIMCGEGMCQRTARCVDGQMGVCAPGEPQIESCNGQDDNCDGLVDNYDVVVIVDTNLETLGQFSPGCRSDELTAPACLQGIHAFCATQGCATTGFGPIGLEDDTITVACVADTVPLATDFARLGAVTGETCFAANQYDTSGCARAYDRYCMAEGHPSGFGPVQVDGEVLQLSCLTRSTAEFLFSYGDLKAEVDECNVRIDGAAVTFCL